MDLGALRKEVNRWFESPALEATMGPATGETERMAREWLGRAGKRWRPFLVAATYRALCPNPDAAWSDDLKKIAVAVECFHKASLIHDDIEDNDDLRYGERTLHAEHGIPVALNVGDLLIGEGYRMIAATSLSAEQKARMLLVASEGQRALCRGQGLELCWARHPGVLTPLQVLDIFRHKTAPAFEVALRLGALFAGVAAHDAVGETLTNYSEALGIAYQIRDDLSDLGTTGETDDISGLRPSLVLAIAFERASGDNRQTMETIWNRQWRGPASGIEAVCREVKADERARQLRETYKQEAVRALGELANPSLKGLLRRVIGKIFNEVEMKGWCREVAQENILRREKTALSSPAPGRV
jgi:geranylgeranyl pyrophosphate synthase